VLSFQRQLDVGLTACRDAVPDLEHLMNLIAVSMDELEQAAGLAQPRRRAARRAATRTRAAKTGKSSRKHAQ
jgi:hypothetical protein